MASEGVQGDATAGFKCFTAPGVVFATREELHAHYKSEWHRYNLKRKVAQLPPIPKEMFDKLQLIAAERERQKNLDVKKLDHVKKSKRGAAESVASASTAAGATAAGGEDEEDAQVELQNPYEVDEEQLRRKVDPCECFIDGHMSEDLEGTLAYMHKKYGFYIPDAEYVCDWQGLYKYCSQKVRAGKLCLYCDRPFKSGQAAIQHIVDKGHCKLPWESDEDLEEYEDFYDFTALNDTDEEGDEDEDDNEDDDDEMADADADETTETDAADTPREDAKKSASSSSKPKSRRTRIKHELLDNGEIAIINEDTGERRVMGHRDYKWIYKQRFQPEETRPALLAASKERLLLAYKKAGVDSSTVAHPAFNGQRPPWLDRKMAKKQQTDLRRKAKHELGYGLQQNLLTKNRVHTKKQMGAGHGVHG
ncbi:Cytoplasmic 60S subunit biosis factor REI1 [Hondaea fermentalgiana]|uniref:Cytoplasmic 60S subunit biosis factor REI1 n=1 Tax=Hondaea fermentalgiana TaxID=2315210 RepID=A0A2R5G4J6_9STRA|nr:Cytoplasmic 60S subunit biosis factor REI1 [Hondaea fermentalgiana]|eukprot:GBG25910.1 Cytoplasmic 60S subunit biosis factor REI1 [Hondaea fermentalgiana]